MDPLYTEFMTGHMYIAGCACVCYVGWSVEWDLPGEIGRICILPRQLFTLPPKLPPMCHWWQRVTREYWVQCDWMSQLLMEVAVCWIGFLADGRVPSSKPCWNSPLSQLSQSHCSGLWSFCLRLIVLAPSYLYLSLVLERFPDFSSLVLIGLRHIFLSLVR